MFEDSFRDRRARGKGEYVISTDLKHPIEYTGIPMTIRAVDRIPGQFSLASGYDIYQRRLKNCPTVRTVSRDSGHTLTSLGTHSPKYSDLSYFTVGLVQCKTG